MAQNIFKLSVVATTETKKLQKWLERSGSYEEVVNPQSTASRCALYFDDERRALEQERALREEFASELNSGALRSELTELCDADWKTKWQLDVRGRAIGDSLFISPVWTESEAAGTRKVIRLDPQLSFGTGFHPTTEMMLELLEKNLAGASSFTASTALDVGTGSGILAIAAELLGASRVVGVDIDSHALEAAANNLRLNGCSRVELNFGGLEQVHESFDLVCANILSGQLVLLWEVLRSRVNERGRILLSGILKEELSEFCHALHVNPLQTSYRGDWVALEVGKI